MASKYWIKLYHEILDDPKMGRLPDNVYRRCIELFLYAGELDADGQLPCSDDIAWRLTRQSEANAEFLEVLDHLERVGILERFEDGWLVVKFAKRQEKVENAERQRQYRKRQRNTEQSLPETKRNADGDGGVTKRHTDKIRIDKELDTTVSGDKKPPPATETKPKPLTVLSDKFTELTDLAVPSTKSDIKYWWARLGAIYADCDKDIDTALRLMVLAVADMQAAGLTISTPGSIYKQVRALKANGGRSNETARTNSTKRGVKGQASGVGNRSAAQTGADRNGQGGLSQADVEHGRQFAAVAASFGQS